MTLEELETVKKKKPSKTILFFVRFFICIAIIITGVMSMKIFEAKKKPPAEVKIKEKVLKVQTLKVVPEDADVSITAHGEVKVLNSVIISPEVAGRAVYVHPDLKPGEMIRQGIILLEVDNRNYLAAVREAKASLEKLSNTIKRMKKKHETDKKRLKNIKRNLDISVIEFERISNLYTVNKVGTISEIEKAERTMNSSQDQLDVMNQQVELFPLELKETESSLELSRARLFLAETNLERCVVKSPIDGRVKSVSVEKGQYLSVGVKAVVIVDDSTLEIHVPLDSLDVKNWIDFDPNLTGTRELWFTQPKKVPCRITWTESPDGDVFHGQLHRVVDFNPQTRTVIVAIRVNKKTGYDLAVNTSAFPIVEGMFCKVEIPGKKIRNVVKVPRWSVTFDETVYSVANGRLKTIPVKSMRTEGEFTFVKNIDAGTEVIVTRLVDPLENMRVEVVDYENSR